MPRLAAVSTLIFHDVVRPTVPGTFVATIAYVTTTTVATASA
jgi:hypothetical protein